LIRFKEVSYAADVDFTKAMALYLEAIPITQRQKVDVIAHRITDGKEKLLLGVLNGETVCMGLVWPLQGCDYALLDYIAVKRNRQNQGIGSSLLKKIVKLPDMQNRDLIIEVEVPQNGEDTETSERRVRFYSRNGAKQMGSVQYILPPLQEDYSTKMNLMVLSKKPRDQIEGDAVKKLIGQIYLELYGRGSDDLLLNSIINSVTSKVAIS
jgi:ribosomal protein S18 acetylase RimI-like enzyme